MNRKLLIVLVVLLVVIMSIPFLLRFMISDSNNKDEQTIKINIDRIGTETYRNTSVDSRNGDYVYYSERGIFLNDEYIQGFGDDVDICNVAIDDLYLYYLETDSETYRLISINRVSKDEKELLTSENLVLFKFDEDILIKYGKDANEIARVDEGIIVELGFIDTDFDASESDDCFVHVSEIDNYKFVYMKREFDSEARLCYVEKENERKNSFLGGGNVAVTDAGLYSTNDMPISDLEFIELPGNNKTDQSLLAWDENELFIISVYGTGPEKIYYSYDRKKSGTLFKYDFKTGTLTQLLTMKPSEGQIIGMSLKKEKIYVLTGNKVYEMSFTGENKKEIGEIPIVNSIYVEMCGDKLFIFSKDEGCELIKIIDM